MFFCRIAPLLLFLISGALCAQGGQADLSQAAAIAEQSLEPALPEGSDDLPRVQILRAPEPPIIDGLLDDAVWEAAPVIGAMTQVTPIEGAEPSERSEIRVLYDADQLYIAVRCFDSQPQNISATQMVRDASLGPDDRIELIVDTFFDRRNAFYFATNPVGARVDGLVENSRDINENWDGIWYCKASIDEQGWVAEIALPYKTLSFDPSTDQWGFNIARSIPRKNERMQWASPRQNISMRSVGSAGIIKGIREIRQGLGLDVKPFLSLKARHDRVRDRDVFTYDPGIDVFYKFTPQLTGALTINTDFAETEVDERQVNLSRFSLFFPEKRDFFLQDAGIFDFGGIRRDPLPFFSRRIGIGANGEPVDILAGVKLTGRVGDFNIGFLDVQVDESDDVDGKNLAVGRVSMNVLEESTIGIIGTFGDPRRNEDNGVAGFDFNYRDSNFLGDKVLTGNLWFQRSFSEEVEHSEYAYGGRISYPNDRISASVGFTHVDEAYRPALGFVRRTGINEYFARFRYRSRPGGWFQRIDHGIFGFMVTDLDNQVESADIDVDLFDIENRHGDEFGVRYTIAYERLQDTFEISDGVILPPGHYPFHRARASFETSSHRPFSFELMAEVGEFYSGNRMQLGASLRWAPSRHFQMRLEYDYNDINLAEGDFITRLGRARFDIYFTPDISWSTLAQYDNVSESLGINSRFRWIIEPGQELFVVINQGFFVDNFRFRSEVTELAAKLGWTFRF